MLAVNNVKVVLRQSPVQAWLVLQPYMNTCAPYQTWGEFGDVFVAERVGIVFP